jgi:hypothetical protein
VLLLVLLLLATFAERAVTALPKLQITATNYCQNRVSTPDQIAVQEIPPPLSPKKASQ